VTWKNTGGLPTALRQARLVKVVREDRVTIEFSGEDTGARVVGQSSVDAGWLDPGETGTATFQVRVSGSEAVEGTIQVLSTRGGVLTHSFTVGGS
jgi:hypothetical protein